MADTNSTAAVAATLPVEAPATLTVPEMESHRLASEKRAEIAMEILRTPLCVDLENEGENWKLGQTGGVTERLYAAAETYLTAYLMNGLDVVPGPDGPEEEETETETEPDPLPIPDEDEPEGDDDDEGA